MPKIDLTTFGGKIPLVDPVLLPDPVAQIATNCDLKSGTLNALRGITQGALLSGTPRAIWKMGDAWISFDTQVSVVNSQIAESNDRFYYTGDGYPKKSDSSVWPVIYHMGVTPPAAAPVITINGTGNGEQQDTVSYVYTVVTTWGEESAPSPQTAVTAIEGNQTITLSGLAQPPTVSNGEYFRIYRLSSSASGVAEYLFLEEISVASVSFDDNNGAGALKTATSEALATENWDAPPADLKGLTQAHNGMLVGYSGKELFVSEPFIPYAFPAKFALAFDTDIQGVGHYDQTIVVMTKTQVYFVTGSDPETLYPDKTGIMQTCISQPGIVTAPDGLCFPSKEGLCFSDGNSAVVLTEKWLSPEQWQAYSPENLVATYYNGKYLGIIKGTATGFMIDLKSGELVDIDLSDSIVSLWDLYYDAETNQLTILGLNFSDEYRVYTFESGAALTYLWKSKQHNDPVNYNRCKITGEDGTVVFKYYLDGVLSQTKTAAVNQTFRLPARGYHIIKEFSVEGTTNIKRIQLATDAGEII